MTCTGCIYDDYEKNCTHPDPAHWEDENCKETDVLDLLELVRIVNAERARV